MDSDSTRNKAAVKLAWKHYLRQLRRDWRLSLGGFLLPGVGRILTTYVPPLIIAQVLNVFSGDASNFGLADFWPFILMLAGVWALGEIIMRIAFYLLDRANARGIKSLYNRAMDWLLEKDIAFFNDNFTGSLTKKATGYAGRYEPFVDTLSISVSSNFLAMIFVSIVLWTYSPLLVVVLLGLMSLTVACVIPLLKKRQKLVAKREASSNKAAGYVADIITNMPAVRTFAHEQKELAQHADNVDVYANDALKSWNYQNLRIETLISPLYIITNTLGLIMAILIAQQNALGIEVIFVTFSYYASLTRIMWEFNQIYRNLESSITEAAQYTELLLEPPVVNDPEKPLPLMATRGDIVFENVSFAYPDQPDQLVFDDLNLHIKPGEKIGLVGPSGGGKTSITKLLLRLSDIQKGSIKVDGYDIRDIRQSDLRKSIAYVPQEPMLFHRSIMENIRYGDEEADDRAVIEFAKLANVDEFVAKLPDGYDTVVGERGVKLSGGQRQRVAIARAMLKNAPIIMLDEATSALDSESEAFIQDALWKLIQRRTAIVIAHRLSTIQKMDRIIVVEDGRILEQGSHKELVNQSGAYASLWQHQSGGFME